MTAVEIAAVLGLALSTVSPLIEAVKELDARVRAIEARLEKGSAESGERA